MDRTPENGPRDAPDVAGDGERPPSVAPTPAENLAAALEAGVHQHEDALANLEHAVCEYTRAMKAGGATPEATLVAVKAFVRRLPEPRWWIGASRTTQDERERLAGAVVRACIAEYYRE
jgi:hypothetical protein